MLSKQDQDKLAKERDEKGYVDTATKEIIHVEDGSLI